MVLCLGGGAMLTEQQPDTYPSEGEFSPDDARALAVRLATSGKPEEAERIYRQVLEQVAPILHDFGALCASAGRTSKGGILLAAAAELLLGAGRYSECLKAAESAVELGNDS